MKRFAAAALAAVAVCAAIAPLPALADGFYRPHRYGGYYGHGDGDLVAAGALGLLGGAVIAGALMPPPPVYAPPVPAYVPVVPAPVYAPPPVPVYSGPVVMTPHVSWCRSRYRSYNVYTNTWIDNYGRVRACMSPYG